MNIPFHGIFLHCFKVFREHLRFKISLILVKKLPATQVVRNQKLCYSKVAIFVFVVNKPYTRFYIESGSPINVYIFIQVIPSRIMLVLDLINFILTSLTKVFS